MVAPLSMSTIQSNFDKIFKKLKELDKKITTVSSRGSATRFVALKDVLWSKDGDDAPKTGSVPRWNPDTQKLSPGGGPPICKLFTYTGEIDSGNTAVVFENLASTSEIDVTRPSIAMVTVMVVGDCNPIANDSNSVLSAELLWDSPPAVIPDASVTFDGVTATLHWNENPVIDIASPGGGGGGTSYIANTNYFPRDWPGIDGSQYRTPVCRVLLRDGLAGAPMPVPSLEYAETSFRPYETNGLTLQWAFSKGQPKVTVMLQDLDDVYDGTYTMYVLTRVVPLP